MNVSFRWLRSIAPGIEGTPEQLAERLAARGFPVEEIRSLAEGLEGIRVARVLAVRPHPNADRLRVCEVDGGDGAVQVVCGAPNVEAGATYAFAPVGASLPGGMTIGKAKLRGEVSEGMLCSERELGLGTGAEGLMVLEGTLEPGRALLEALGLDDIRLDIEVTSNRPDMLSHEGVARELAPAGHKGLHLPDFPGEDPALTGALEGIDVHGDVAEVSAGGVTVRIEAPERCARYLGLVVRGVRVGPSPDWLRARLRAAGARPINNVVDATNYVLLETGQPLHAFDLSRLKDQTVVVRTARSGESLRTLDGVERALSPSMLAICDASDPVAVAGVMGGEHSEVTEATTDLLLECALFTPGPIRATRKSMGVSTDASYRFERGVDPEGMIRALLRTVRIILATAGGGVSGPILDVHPAPFNRPRIRLRSDRVASLLGVAFDNSAIRDLLAPLGFILEEEAGGWVVEVPGFRSWDVRREVDLIEEIARTYGFDAFPDDLGPFRPSSVPDHPLFALEDRLRDEMVAAGLLEAQTPAFAPAGEGEVELLNPISSEERFLRATLLPGLIRRLEYNLARGNRDVRLFEVGTTFHAGPPGELPREETRLAAVLHGLRAPRHWHSSAAEWEMWDIKGLMERIARHLAAEGWQVSHLRDGIDPQDGLDPACAFRLADRSGAIVGTGGRLATTEADLPPWAGDVWVLQIVLPASPAPNLPVVYRPLPSHPGVDRDLALLVPDATPVAQVLEVARTVGGEHLREIGVFDVYRDEGIGADARSVAIRLRFRATDRTLTDAEVDERVRAITRTLQEELRVGFRGAGD